MSALTSTRVDREQMVSGSAPTSERADFNAKPESG